MDFNYHSKIHELEELKERNKIIRQIRQSKERLLHENPQAIAPFLKEKLRVSVNRDPFFGIQKTNNPVEYRPPVSLPVASNKERDYLDIFRNQKHDFESELQQMKMREEKLNQNVKERFEQFMILQEEKTAKNLDEIRNYLKLINKNQMDIQSYRNGKQTIITDLKNLKNQYVFDGGTDFRIIRDIEQLLEDAERNPKDKPPSQVNWNEMRRNMILALEKSNELRDLERLNADLENQLAINRARSSNLNVLDKKNQWDEEMEKYHLDKIEKLQNQIQSLQDEINILKQPKVLEIAPKENEEPPKLSNTKPVQVNDKLTTFIFMLDYISGIGQYVTSASVTLSVFNELGDILQPVESKLVSVAPQNKTDLDTSVIFDLKQPLINCPVSKTTYALILLKIKTNQHPELRLESWTRVSFVNEYDELNEGTWTSRMYSLPVQPFVNEYDLILLKQYHRAVLNYRILSSLDTDNSTISTNRIISPQYIQPIPINNTISEQTVNLEFQKNDIVSDDDDAKSDISADMDEKPEFGIQVIRIKNLAVGSGLEFAKVYLTVYHTDGFKKNQILMGTMGPVTCSTSSVRADFKVACYQFGRQTGQFTGLDLSINCVLYARFYLEKKSNSLSSRISEQQNQNEEELIAWTAIKLLKRRRIARNNPSFSTDHMKLFKLNKALHDLPLYEPPVISSTDISFDKKGFITGSKLFGRAKLKIRIFHTRVINESATSSDEVSNDENEYGIQKPWLGFDRPEPILVPYHHDDGIDLYIDSGRLFPDSTTVVKIDGRIVNRNLISQGPKFSASTLLSSDIFNPQFNERIEIRDPQLTPSSTILFKIMTFDREDKTLVDLGYAALKLFVETGTNRQPEYDELGVLVSLNDGGHQIRIYSSGPKETDFPFTESWFESNNILHIPGVSLLIRLYKAQKNSDGKPLNINEVPKGQQESLGVVIPVPSYDNGYYYSMICKPNEAENQIMKQHILRPKLILKDLLISKWSDKLKEAVPFGDIFGENNWIKLFDKFTSIAFNRNRIVKYSPAFGFKIAVDGCMNIPWGGYPMAVVSLYPPGALYLNKPLMAFDRPFLVSQLNLESSPSAPIWSDGWKTFKRRKYDRYLVAILHLHEIGIKILNTDYTFSLENEAWIPVQIFDNSYCITKAIQMPLIVGSPKLNQLEELKNKTVKQFLDDNLNSKKITLMENASVIIRLCDTRRALEVSLTPQNNLLTLDQSYIPGAKLSAYRSLYKSNRERQFSKSIPIGLTEESLQKMLQIKFKSLVYQFYNENGFYLQ